jgi:hypothetical protein
MREQVAGPQRIPGMTFFLSTEADSTDVHSLLMEEGVTIHIQSGYGTINLRGIISRMEVQTDFMSRNARVNLELIVDQREFDYRPPENNKKRPSGEQRIRKIKV